MQIKRYIVDQLIKKQFRIIVVLYVNEIIITRNMF